MTMLEQQWKQDENWSYAKEMFAELYARVITPTPVTIGRTNTRGLNNDELWQVYMDCSESATGCLSISRERQKNGATDSASLWRKRHDLNACEGERPACFAVEPQGFDRRITIMATTVRVVKGMEGPTPEGRAAIHRQAEIDSEKFKAELATAGTVDEWFSRRAEQRDPRISDKNLNQ